MSIKLRFDRHPNYPTTPVWTEDPFFAAIGGMLFSDLPSVGSARQWAERLRGVVAGTVAPFQGVGNGYFCAIFPTESEVGLNIGEEPETVTVSTPDLIAAVEEWAAHLEALGRKP